MPGADEHSFPLYSVPDAERLRLHLRELLRVHLRPAAAQPIRGPADVVIVGGGPTGVETAGAIAELFDALRGAGRLGDAAIGAPRRPRQGAAEAVLRQVARVRAATSSPSTGVQVTFGVAVTRGATRRRVSCPTAADAADPHGDLGGGESAAPDRRRTGAHARAAAAGSTSHPICRCPGFDGVFAVGDVANIPGPDGRALPQLGSVAQQSGTVGGPQHPRRAATARPPTPFHYHDKGIMAMIGRNAAVAEIGPHRHQLDGPIAFAAWLGLHAILLSGVHSRVDAFLNWADDYFHHDRAPTSSSTAPPTRIAWADDSDDRPTIDASLERRSRQRTPI